MQASPRKSLVIATRRSALALKQTEIVRNALMAAVPGLRAELLLITTKGDTNLAAPLSVIGGKGLFVTELEDALRAGHAHLAVHSAKDLPTSLADGARIGAYMPRADARDVLVSNSVNLAALPAGSRVGTSSPRRAALIRSMRPDVTTADIRGNVDTRLRKLRAGDYDALVLAAAGLVRLGLESEITEWFDTDTMIPAPGQGALAVEVMAADNEVAEMVALLNDPHCEAAVTAERSFLRAFGGGCSAPIGAFATISGDKLSLAGMVTSSDGKLLRASADGPVVDAVTVGEDLAVKLRARGAEMFGAHWGQQ